MQDAKYMTFTQRKNLGKLHKWLKSHPGRTAAGLLTEIRALPWEEPRQCLESVIGTRWDTSVPTTAGLYWQLVCLALQGNADKIDGKWYAK